MGAGREQTYTSDVTLSSLSWFSNESMDSPSSLLTERLLDRDPTVGEWSGGAEWEAQVQPEPPVQWPRA
jgi:hypothetical protein